MPDDFELYIRQTERWRGSVERAIEDHDGALEATEVRCVKVQAEHKKVHKEIDDRLKVVEITWAKITGIAFGVGIVMRYLWPILEQAIKRLE